MRYGRAGMDLVLHMRVDFFKQSVVGCSLEFRLKASVQLPQQSKE